MRLRQVGEVTAVHGNTATVKVQQHPACAACRQKCAIAHEAKEVSVVAENYAQAEVGDCVNIELSDTKVLKAAFLMYIVPVLMLFAGVGIGMWVGLGETKALFLGLLGLMGSFLALKFVVDPYIRRQTGYNLAIVSIAKQYDYKESR